MAEYRTVRETELLCRYVISLLAAVLQKSTPPPLPHGLTWNDVYATAKFHGVEAMAFYGAQKYLEKDGSLYRQWKQRRDQNIIQGMTQIGERDEILRKLTEEGIRVLPLKGCVMKELYRQVDFRQMTDLDLLVEPQNLMRAGEILQAMGYTKGDSEDYHDSYSRLPYMQVELHGAMLSKAEANHGYYADVWERAIPGELPGCMKLTTEDFYIYHLAHFAKHFESMGSGIRSIMDIYIYLRKYGKEMDRAYLNRELSKMQLKKLCDAAEALSLQWFSPGKNKNADGGRKLREIEKMIFYSGLYGTRFAQISRRIFAYQATGKRTETIRYVMKRIFMEREEAVRSYPFLKKYPFLLPVCWVHRMVWAMRHKRDEIRSELEMIGTPKKGRAKNEMRDEKHTRSDSCKTKDTIV